MNNERSFAIVRCLMVGVAVLGMFDGEAISPLTRVGGVSLLKRAVLTAQKAGVTTCYLCVEHVTDALRRLAAWPEVTPILA